MPWHSTESKVDGRRVVVIQWFSCLHVVCANETERRRYIERLVVQPPHLQQHGVDIWSLAFAMQWLTGEK